MVTLFFLLLASLPTIESPVSDSHGYLTSAEREHVSDALLALRDRTGVQMAVVLVETTAGTPIEDYAQTIFDGWGGGSAERDDGVLLVFAIGDRRSRLHLGYGLEPYIADHSAKIILDEQIPALKRGDFASACLGAVRGVAERVDSLRPGESIEIPLGMTFPAAMVWVWCLGILAGFIWAWRGVSAEPFDPEAPEPNRWVALFVWLGAPLVLGAIFWQGRGFWFAYPIVWWSGALFSFLLVFTGRRIDDAIGIMWGFFTCIAVPVVVATELPHQCVQGNHLIGSLAEILLGVGIAGAAAALLRGLAAAAASGDSSSGTSSGWSSSSGASSSTWSSSSSSSWSSSSSSSSSSTSWSGGGGSSGGGGASSSW